MKVYSFDSFMTGEYKKGKAKNNKGTLKKASSIGVPLAVASTPLTAFAQEESTLGLPDAGQYIGQKTVQAFAHILDPVIDLLVALSFPIASVIIVGSFFLFMFGNTEKAWSTIQRAGLGYILIQLSPFFLDILKNVGTTVTG